MAPAAVTASLGTLGPLLVKLTALLAGEYGRLKGVRREILSLRCELATMHAAVQKYMMLEDPDVQVKEWISIVRELAYDIEDCLDNFILWLGYGGRHGGFKEFFRKTARQLKTLKARRGIANQIDELKARIKQVKELKDSYKLDETFCGTTRHAALDPRLHALFAEEAHFVGVDGPRDDLAKWMLEDGNISSKHRRVLSIVGFGGLGKTTLANEVYRRIQGHFDCQAFVSVSQKPDLKKIIKDVIYKVPSPDGFTKGINIWDEMTSIAKLRELLQDKRYLVIIDDIWSILAWDAIRCAFPENNCCSRIIVTTRIVEVAKSCCPGGDDRMYEMQPLSDLHSRRLFFKRIFGSENCCYDMLENVSNEILKKCGGLPLAINSISGLLANRPAIKEEWEKVKTSIGSALEKSQSLEGVNNILSLSYNHLSPNLKTCLLYLSIFPEDYMIVRERLVSRWIAEGFISKERGQSQQEVAEHYFYELINKSMVQPVDIGYDGKARACRVHDMMLEIIISKSAEENFTTVVGDGQTSLANSHGFIRRLSVQHIDQELASALANEDLSHVRSLTVTTSGCLKHFPSLVEFEALRVLDFEDCKGLEEYSMNNVDKLFQLKYINLSGTGISKVPSGILMVRDLETLDLRYTSVKELPPGIVQLIKLQHLRTGRYCKVPSGIGNMRDLRVASGFDITTSSVGAVEELGNLTSLNELDVRLDGGGSGKYKRHEEMLLSSLCNLGSSKLQSFRIAGSDGSLGFLDSWSPLPSLLQIFDIVGNCFFTDIPKWIVPALTSLGYLRIRLTELREDGLHTLGQLPALLSLTLTLKTGPKDRFTVQGNGFQTLKKFKIFSNDGAYVRFVKGAMPKLDKLKVSFHVSVAKKNGFYLGIEHLLCLKKVKSWIDNEDATYSECKAAIAAIRKEAVAHPNHPTVDIRVDLYEEYNEETGSEEENSREDGDTDEN